MVENIYNLLIWQRYITPKIHFINILWLFHICIHYLNHIQQPPPAPGTPNLTHTDLPGWHLFSCKKEITVPVSWVWQFTTICTSSSWVSDALSGPHMHQYVCGTETHRHSYTKINKESSDFNWFTGGFVCLLRSLWILELTPLLHNWYRGLHSLLSHVVMLSFVFFALQKLCNHVIIFSTHLESHAKKKKSLSVWVLWNVSPRLLSRRFRLFEYVFILLLHFDFALYRISDLS